MYMEQYLQKIEFNLQEKKEFFGSFSSLYESGLAVGDIFKSMKLSTRNEKIRTVCSFVLKCINEGNSLKEALLPFSKALGIAYSALLATGEESGKLDNILSCIYSNIEKQQEIKSNLINALLYPVFIFFAAITVAMFFQFFINPSFRSVYDYNISTNTVNLLFTAVIKIIIVYLIIFGLLFYVYKTQKIKESIKKFFSSLWIIRGILRNYYFTNYFYVLSLAYEAGVPSGTSVMLANSVIGIKEIKEKLKNAEKNIETGMPVSEALNITGLFSGFVMSQIAAGEQAGKLDKSFKKAAKDYENKMDTVIKTMQKLLGPIVLFIVGIIVALVAAKSYSEYYKAIFSMF